LPDGTIDYLLEAVYHGNPIGKGKGSLVTTDWGLDVSDFTLQHGGMSTTTYGRTRRRPCRASTAITSRTSPASSATTI
jgi:hypothetical protein